MFPVLDKVGRRMNLCCASLLFSLGWDYFSALPAPSNGMEVKGNSQMVIQSNIVTQVNLYLFIRKNKIKLLLCMFISHFPLSFPRQHQNRELFFHFFKTLNKVVFNVCIHFPPHLPKDKMRTELNGASSRNQIILFFELKVIGHVFSKEEGHYQSCRIRYLITSVLKQLIQKSLEIAWAHK